jgi:peptidoglycan/LPS O-acetylase OafA/YrhL
MLVTSLPRAIGFVIASIAFASVSNSVLPHVLTGLTWNELGFFSYYWFPANLQSFACGCLAYHLLPFAPGLARRRGAGTAIGLMALLIAVFTAWYGLPWFSTMEAPWSRATLASFASLALAMALAVHSPRWLVNPMTCYVGQVSYSAYLLHFMIFEPVLAHFGPIGVGPVVSMIGFAGSFVAIAAMTVGLSGLTWRAIERPGITAGNRLIARCFATGVVSRANYP